MRSVPASGCSWPVIIRNSVVLPAPLGPITPTIPPGGSEKVRSSISSWSPKPLRRFSASTTTSPRRVAGGMWIWTSSSLTLRSSATQRLVVLQARLLLGLAALGVLAHPLELGGDRALARLLGLLLLRQARLLLLEPGRVVALVGDAAAAVELEDPAGDVVEEVAIVGDGDDGALVLGRGGARARRPTRRRGGWSARRAAAGRARAAAAGTARRGGARRRRASSRRRRPGAGAARPSRTRRWCRGSRRRRRRSAPAAARTRRRSRRSSWRPAR